MIKFNKIQTVVIVGLAAVILTLGIIIAVKFAIARNANTNSTTASDSQ